MKRPHGIAPPSSARLFSEAPPGPPAGIHVANVDGASRGNPGPASYAVVIRDAAGQVVLELGKQIGRTTNNVAEYYALLAALDYSTNQGIKALRIRSDSELLVRQMQGRYKVKSPDLKPLFERAAKLARQLEYFVIEHVPREKNRDADALANIALDSGSMKVESAAAQKEVVRPAPVAPPIPQIASYSIAPTPSRIRARFTRGVLVPLEPLNLREGTELSLEIRMSPHED